ncbi:MAG TPA: alpha/beta hydrolase [Rhodopila sp.]|nr:alpha/beta hydrolase [Rhodopila sp.]
MPVAVYLRAAVSAVAWTVCAWTVCAWAVCAVVATGVVHPAMAGRAIAPVLDWKPCDASQPNAFDCATAKVPLDYADPDGQTINLAVIRHKATGPGARIGTLFFNPGGPGGSGVTDLPAFLSLFPKAAQQRFDIVSWDPRGTNASTAVQCFVTANEEARFFTGVPTRTFPIGNDQITDWLARFKRFARICKDRNGALLSHVSTVDTARDMDLLRQAVGEAKLNYIGTSYGTLLGAIYANLYPNQVRAMILDGVVDPVAWDAGPGNRPVLSTSLRIGSDIAVADSLNAFLDRCGQAGPGACAFSTGDAAGTHAKFNRLVARIKATPGSFQGKTIDYAALYTAMANLLTTALPEPGFPGWTFAATFLQTLWTSADSPATPVSATAPTAPAGPTYTSDFQANAIQCGESPNARAEAFHWLNRFTLNRAGPIGLHGLWADETCADWQVTAAETYQGPWDAQTPNPILVIGNTHDPSTPYSDAVALTKELAKSRLLTVDGFGHTVLLNPSRCAGQIEGDYLVSGALPAIGTTCPQDAMPF